MEAYLITCIPTDKKYIGITRRPIGRRWAQHAKRGTHRTAATKAKLSRYWSARRERGEFKTVRTYEHFAERIVALAGT